MTYYKKILENKNKEIKKIYHCGDIHIKRKYENHEEYTIVFNNLGKILKNEKKASICVCTGDIINDRDNFDIGTYNQLKYFIKNITDIMPMIIIPGNHDINITSNEDYDLLYSICNTLNTKNELYYLRESGLYEYNNIMFFHSSIIDKKIIKADEINTDKIKICLHHGFIENKKDTSYNFITNSLNYLKLEQIRGYYAVLLSDIHYHHYIEYNISYSSSLIQQSYKENIKGHGIICWDIEHKYVKSNFIEIPNPYCYITIRMHNNKIIEEKDIKNISKNIRLRIINDDCTNEFINEYINKLGKNHNIIKKTIITYPKIKQSEMDTIDTIDITNNEFIIKIIKKYLEEYEKNKINDVIEMHKNYMKYITLNVHNKKIIIEKLKFSNVFSYGENNIIDFTKMDQITRIVGNNRAGKSSIFDILCKILFNESFRHKSCKNNILNINKNDYTIELEIIIDEIKYKIKEYGKKINNKTKKNGIKIEITTELYKYENNEYIKINHKNNTHTNIREKINEILNYTCDNFLFGNIMPQYNSKEILDLTNINRKQMLSSFLQLNIFTIINKKVKEKIKIIKNNILELTTIKSTYKKINEEYTKEYILQEKYKIDYEKAKNILITLEENLNKNNNKLTSMNDIYVEDILNKEISKTRKLLNKITNEIEILEKNILSISTINDEIINKITDNNRFILRSIITNIIEKRLQEYEINIRNIIKNKINDYEKIKDKLVKLYKMREKSKEKDKIITMNIEINKKITEIYKDIHQYEKEIYACKKFLDKKINNENDLIKITEIINKIEYEYEILKIYENITSINGIINNITTIKCKEIELHMNEILEKFNIKIKLENDNEIKIPVLNLYRIIDNNKIECERSSGSERFLINLAFKIAINKITNHILKILIIDESLSCMDDEHMINLESLINLIKNNFDKSIIISHRDINQIKSLIKINKLNNQSIIDQN